MLFLRVMLLLLLSAGSLMAGEGMWLMTDVHRLPLDTLRAHGLRLSAADIYAPDRPSLTDVMVMLPGGTGSFISDSGLILTNHHIAYGAIQQLSSTANDYLRDGFLARDRSAELSTSYTASVITAIRDVTEEVRAAVPADLGPEERVKAVQAAMRAVETAAAREGELTTHRVSEMFNGLQYVLFTTLTLRDVRLVYAPPGSIGNFGGEVDNWIWPRHTGDFAIMRAYTGPDGKPAPYAPGNIPHRPRAFLPVSARGVQQGDVAMVMGFPGRTFRSFDAASAALAQESLPWQVRLGGERIAVLEAAGRNDRAVEIAYAARLRGIANGYKNYQGVLEGMRRADFLAVKRAQDEKLAAFIASTPDLRREFGDVIPALESAAAGSRAVSRKNALYMALMGGVDMLGTARRVAAFAERTGADGAERPSGEERTALRDSLARSLGMANPAVDRATLEAMILLSAELPAGQRIPAFDAVTRGRTGDELRRTVRGYVEELYEESRLTAPEKLLDLLGDDPDDMLDDPFVRLRQELAADQAPVTAAIQKNQTLTGHHRARYIAARMRMDSTRLFYPDANRTLRFGYGLVTTLEPRDAVHLSHVTSLRGVMEKEDDEEPFLVPPRLRELWEKKDFGGYGADGDMPVAFLATLDNTGGSSGSPVINGRGELIGCAFDGNWEGVLGDYHYQDRLNRAISVDARYMLFVLDRFAGAQNILRELVIR